MSPAMAQRGQIARSEIPRVTYVYSGRGSDKNSGTPLPSPLSRMSSHRTAPLVRLSTQRVILQRFYDLLKFHRPTRRRSQCTSSSVPNRILSIVVWMSYSTRRYLIVLPSKRDNRREDLRREDTVYVTQNCDHHA